MSRAFPPLLRLDLQVVRAADGKEMRFPVLLSPQAREEGGVCGQERERGHVWYTSAGLLCFPCNLKGKGGGGEGARW